MLFYSQLYLVFLASVFAVYWLLPWQRARVWLLVGASFGFYASWSGSLALLVTGTTVFDYFFARGLDSSRTFWRRKLLLGLSLSMNLGVLSYFKYANFFLDSLRESLALIGVTASTPYLDLIIPFGISFYTFEAISYTVDVYRGRIRAERNLGNLLLFILFFPHLVAGPIVRGRDFLPQIPRPKRFDWLRVKLGIELFLIGLFKKLVLGDNLALYTDVLFDPNVDVTRLEPGAVWVGVFAYMIRMYCDFSGYSDMALGSAHLLGYKLVVNFRMPFLAVNVADFWRRWHISLSNWLRDYIFFPLGGSRGGSWKTARNLLITMTLCGLWHGAAWSYPVFGVVHAIAMISERWLEGKVKQRPELNRLFTSRIGTLVRIVWTFTFVSVTVVMIQPSLQRAIQVYTALIPVDRGFLRESVPDMTKTIWLVVLFFLGQMIMLARLLRWYALKPPGALQGAGYALLLAVTCLLSPTNPKIFVYFQF